MIKRILETKSNTTFNVCAIERIIVVASIMIGLGFYSVKISKLKSRIASAESLQSAQLNMLREEFRELSAIMRDIQLKLK